MISHKAKVEPIAICEMSQQAIEQRNVGTRLDGEVKVGNLASIRPARIDHDDSGAPRLACRVQALEQYRMAPGEVRTDEYDEIGQFKVFIGARHGVGTER